MVVVPLTVCNFCGESEPAALPVLPVGEDPGELGTVTPGMAGRFAGGLLARGDSRIWMRKARSYTILVPPGV